VFILIKSAYFYLELSFSDCDWGIIDDVCRSKGPWRVTQYSQWRFSIKLCTFKLNESSSGGL